MEEFEFDIKEEVWRFKRDYLKVPADIVAGLEDVLKRSLEMDSIGNEMDSIGKLERIYLATDKGYSKEFYIEIKE
jgi:hypothetical protein